MGNPLTILLSKERFLLNKVRFLLKNVSYLVFKNWSRYPPRDPSRGKECTEQYSTVQYSIVVEQSNSRCLEHGFSKSSKTSKERFLLKEEFLLRYVSSTFGKKGLS